MNMKMQTLEKTKHRKWWIYIKIKSSWDASGYLQSNIRQIRQSRNIRQDCGEGLYCEFCTSK